MKKIVSIVAFCLILVLSIRMSNDILVEKYLNRYFMLSKELKTIDNIEVQVYGSCHAYSSFNSKMFTDMYGVYSYNMANPSETIPASYLRMYERFKIDTPKVALVEIWGINAYDTYITKEEILDTYLRTNIENIPFSWEKVKVINDFEALDLLEDNISIFKYKDRILDFALNEVDFDYSFERANAYYNPEGNKASYNEMKTRLENNGFWACPSDNMYDYEAYIPEVREDEKVAVEADLLKYIDKIIQLCEEQNVKLIFYRAPYRSNATELKKVNWLEDYLREKNVAFYDLEPAIEWDYTVDFYDYEHLSETGAEKATLYLSEIINKELEK